MYCDICEDETEECGYCNECEQCCTCEICGEDADFCDCDMKYIPENHNIIDAQDIPTAYEWESEDMYRAFKKVCHELSNLDIAIYHSYWCCWTCSGANLHHQIETGKIPEGLGIGYYNQQNAEFVRDKQWATMGFVNHKGEPDLLIGACIVRVLKMFGFEVQWEEDKCNPIEFKWGGW